MLIKLHNYLRELIFPTSELIGLIPKNSKILDLGCGSGFIFNNLKNYKSYLGIDINSKKIKKLNNFNKNPTPYFLCHDITKKNLKSIYKKFDTILLIDVIHHIEKNKQLKCLTNILKQTKKNTLIVIKDIDHKNFITSKFNWFHDLIINRCLISYFDFVQIKKRRGLLIIEEFTTRKFLYDHYFLIIKKT